MQETVGRVQALSMSWRVARAVREDGWSGEVIAVHPRSVYLSDENSEIYAVVQSPLGNGPFNLVVPGAPESMFRGLAPGSGAASGDAVLSLGAALQIELDRATLWDPKAYPAPADPAALDHGLAVLFETAASKAPAQSLARLLPYLADEDLPSDLARPAHFPRSHALMCGIVDALARRNKRGLKVVASSLAGLGPGLTPAGDDFIAGLLFALAAAQEHTPDAAVRDLAAMLLETAVTRTHEVSAAYLRAAHAGEAAERWHPLLAAVAAGDAGRIRPAAAAVMQAGETSGADMLAGFVCGMRAICGTTPLGRPDAATWGAGHKAAAPAPGPLRPAS